VCSSKLYVGGTNSEAVIKAFCANHVEGARDNTLWVAYRSVTILMNDARTVWLLNKRRAEDFIREPIEKNEFSHGERLNECIVLNESI